jgi:hypothetical protein
MAQPDELKIPDAAYPTLPASAADSEGFAPPGWVVEMLSSGDVNGDQIPDIVFVLHQTSRANILANKDGFGEMPIDTNPRILAVAIGQGPDKPYRLLVQDHTLIPRHVEPTLSDPLADGGVAVKHGAFIVTLGSFASMGSWEMSTRKLTFRIQDDRCVLIGFDEDGRMRNTGEETTTSINYLSGRKITGHAADPGSPLRTHTTQLPPSTPLSIDQVGDGMDFDPAK